MQRSPKLTQQLDLAEAKMKAMEASSTLDELEANWKDFLSHLERFWYKSNAHFGRSPKWKAWGARYQRAREMDPLLSYLKEARGAHEHTLEEIAAKTPGSITITAGPTGSGGLRGFEIKDGVLTADVAAGSIQFTFAPDRVVTLAIRTRSREYPPPTLHLGARVDPENVVLLARVGYEYYKQFLKDTEAYLVEGSDV